MRFLLLASILALPLAPMTTPAFAEGLTITGSNGGTIEKSRDCSRVAGQADCTTDTTYKTASGETATKSRVRVTTPGQSSSEITFTGLEGNTKTRKRLLTWGN